MTGELPVYVGSFLIIGWGVAHAFPTRAVVRGFGPISEDNRRIITMEWILEALTLCFIGILVLLTALIGEGNGLMPLVVYRTSAAMLVIMAMISFMTGGRTSIVPIKICPLVKTVAAVLIFWGGLGTSAA
jgi:hypothetical protein